ncbi:protein Mis18-beta isoform X1 [Tympanuchus pallidicinctus]|uniref:protein Mis18-beta isoform X1 n=1 Tax=Tympanuchus pallidicinctus TaxID=109042 RepID=UPI00228721C4|nr:protein Mis18-beta isoform X1 [Tympanuchus pallidicinctus]
MARPRRRAVRFSAGREEMAVRRQLRRFFEEPQIRGTIVVERPLSSEPPPAPAPASASEVPQCCELRAEDCAVFQCRGCWAVLGDSLHLCALEEQRLGLVVCLRVTSNVLCEEELMVGLEGALTGCAYNTLSCQSCGTVVGFVLYSAFRDLTHLRGFFCFFKKSIFCYLLKSKMIIEASKVKFPAVTLKDQIEKLKESLVMTHMRIELLMKKVEQLKQNNVAENKALHHMELS